MVADCRRPRDGRFIERIGCYNPVAKGCNVILQVEKERMVYWLSQGAQATLRVQHLIKKLEKSSEKAKKNILGKGKLRYLQSECQSTEAQKVQDKAANIEKAKVEEVPCG